MRAGNPVGSCRATCRRARCSVAVRSLEQPAYDTSCVSVTPLTPAQELSFPPGYSLLQKKFCIRDGSDHPFSISRGPACPTVLHTRDTVVSETTVGIMKLTRRIDQCVMSFGITCSSSVVPAAIFQTVTLYNAYEKALLKIIRQHGQSREVINFCYEIKTACGLKGFIIKA